MSLRISISVTRILIIALTILLFFLLIISFCNEITVGKRAIGNSSYIRRRRNFPNNGTKTIKQIYDTTTNRNLLILANYKNNKLQLYNKNSTIKLIKGENVNQSTSKVRQQIKSKSLQHSKTNVYRRHNKFSKKEIPFDVPGWPMGASFSVDDYVDFFGITSIVLPDISKDSSIFDERNKYSVLIAVGKFKYPNMSFSAFSNEV